MLIPRSAGRPIPAENDEASFVPRGVPIALTTLALLAAGIVIGLILGNHVLVTQRGIYGEANMSATSVVLDLLDDLLPYLVWSITGTVLLTVLAVASWLLAVVRSPALRHGFVALLVLLTVAAAIWFGLGRRTTQGPVRMVTPTPVASVPDL